MYRGLRSDREPRWTRIRCPFGQDPQRETACTSPDGPRAEPPADTVRVSVPVRYGFSGVDRPVDAPPAVNVVQAGRVWPLKWRLVDADGVAIDDLEGVRVRTAPVPCDRAEHGAEVDEYAAGGSGFQNLGEGAYQFNWSTLRSYRGSPLRAPALMVWCRRRCRPVGRG